MAHVGLTAMLTNAFDLSGMMAIKALQRAVLALPFAGRNVESFSTVNACFGHRCFAFRLAFAFSGAKEVIFSAGRRLKLLAAVLTGHINRLALSDSCALQRTVSRFCCGVYCEFRSAYLACANILFSPRQTRAFARAVFGVESFCSEGKFFSAILACLFENSFAAARLVSAFLAAKHLVRVAFDAEFLSALFASVSVIHKRNLLSDGWHVCLGHAGPTGGIHNYIRLGANHQARTCPKQLHYSTSLLAGVIL